MASQRHSKRFNPNSTSEKIVPLLLIVLLVILVAVLVIIGLSLVGIFPMA